MSKIETPTVTPTTQDEPNINIFQSLKSKVTKGETIVTKETQQKLSTLDTKSKMIRYLHKSGYNNGQISNILGIRYQHVYNVLHQVVKS